MEQETVMVLLRKTESVIQVHILSEKLTFSHQAYGKEEQAFCNYKQEETTLTFRDSVVKGTDSMRQEV